MFVDLLTGGQLTPEFIAINPAHTVPVLEDKTNNITLTESCAILQYLAEVFQLHGAWGIPQEDFAVKHKVLNALANHPNVSRKTTMVIFDTWRSFWQGTPFDVEVLKSHIALAVKDLYPMLEAALLRNNGWLAADVPTIADAHAFPEIFQVTKTEGNFTMALYDFAEFPAIRAWLERCAAVWFDETDEDWVSTKGFVEYTFENIPAFRLLE